jgi:hypothetical protein
MMSAAALGARAHAADAALNRANPALNSRPMPAPTASRNACANWNSLT